MTAFIRSIRDLRTSVAGAIALMLTFTACVSVVVAVVRGEPSLTEILALVGALISPATALLAEPRKHGRATDPAPRSATPPDT